MKHTNYMHCTLALVLTALMGCKKEDAFLSVKPDQQLFVPSTLTDLAQLMHNETNFNYSDPSLSMISSEPYYVTSEVWAARTTSRELNGYIWEKNVYDAGQSINDWSNPYQQVYYCNTVLGALPTIPVPAGEEARAGQIKGEALFFRGRAFYNLLQTFTVPYDPQTAEKDLGILLRLSPDYNIKPGRSSVKAGYDQVLQDLLASVDLLPSVAAYRTQPGKPAVYGLLSRVYLALSNFEKSLEYANKALALFSTLTDYNTLVPQTRAISTDYISEDIFHSVVTVYSLLSTNTISITDSVLYRSYASNDLRKTAYFILKSGLPYYRGTYDYKRLPYTGIATDELFLNIAECEARQGNAAQAIQTLNKLLITRWKTGTFVPYTAASAEDALRQILVEREKELLWRGIRWTDLRRLNKEPRFATTLKRVINGVTYTLPPNDLGYAWPLPDGEIIGSGVQQNPR